MVNLSRYVSHMTVSPVESLRLLIRPTRFYRTLCTPTRSVLFPMTMQGRAPFSLPLSAFLSQRFSVPFHRLYQTEGTSFDNEKKILTQLRKCGDTGDYEKALMLLDEASEQGITLSGKHYGQAVLACAKKSRTDILKSLLTNITEENVLLNAKAIDSVVEVFSKRRDYQGLLEFLLDPCTSGDQPLSLQAVREFTLAARCLHDAPAVLKVFKHAIQVDTPLEPEDFVHPIRSCGLLHKDKEMENIIMFMNENAIEVYPEIYTEVVRAYFTCKKIKKVLHILKTQPNLEEKAYRIAIKNFMLYNKYDLSKQLFDEMIQKKLNPSSVSISSVLSIALEEKEQSKVDFFWQKLQEKADFIECPTRSDFRYNEDRHKEHDDETKNALTVCIVEPTFGKVVKSAVKTKNIEFLVDIHRFFDKKQYVIPGWVLNDLFRGYAYANRLPEAWNIYCNLFKTKSPVIQQAKMYLGMVDACTIKKDLEKVKHIWNDMEENLEDIHGQAYASIVCAFASCNDYASIQEIIERMEEKIEEMQGSEEEQEEEKEKMQVFIYGGILRGLSTAGDVDGISDVLAQMEANKMTIPSYGIENAANTFIEKEKWTAMDSLRNTLLHSVPVDSSTDSIVSGIVLKLAQAQQWERVTQWTNTARKLGRFLHFRNKALFISELIEKGGQWKAAYEFLLEVVDSKINQKIYEACITRLFPILLEKQQALYLISLYNQLYYVNEQQPVDIHLQALKAAQMTGDDKLSRRISTRVHSQLRLSRSSPLSSTKANEKTEVYSSTNLDEAYDYMIGAHANLHEHEKVIDLFSYAKYEIGCELSSFGYNAMICACGRTKQLQKLIIVRDELVKEKAKNGVIFEKHVYRSLCLAFSKINHTDQIMMTWEKIRKSIEEEKGRERREKGKQQRREEVRGKQRTKKRGQSAGLQEQKEIPHVIYDITIDHLLSIHAPIPATQVMLEAIEQDIPISPAHLSLLFTIANRKAFLHRKMMIDFSKRLLVVSVGEEGTGEKTEKSKTENPHVMRKTKSSFPTNCIKSMLKLNDKELTESIFEHFGMDDIIGRVKVPIRKVLLLLKHDANQADIIMKAFRVPLSVPEAEDYSAAICLLGEHAKWEDVLELYHMSRSSKIPLRKEAYDVLLNGAEIVGNPEAITRIVVDMEQQQTGNTN